MSVNGTNATTVDNGDDYFVEESLPLSLFLATMGGLLDVLAILVIAYPNHLSKTTGAVYSSLFLQLTVLASIFLKACNGAASIASTWFGPVSIVEPTIRTSQLVFNMLLFGPTVFGIEVFTHDMVVGTYNILLGTILLPIVGPQLRRAEPLASKREVGVNEVSSTVAVSSTGDILTVDEGEGVDLLPSTVWAYLWLAVLAISTTGCLFVLLRSNIHRDWTKRGRFRLLIVAYSSTAVFAGSLAKIIVNVQSSRVQFLVLGLGFICAVMLYYVNILQATAVDQATFVPTLTTFTVLLSAWTGVVVWDDARAVRSWIGYLCVFMMLALGSALLVPNIDRNRDDFPQDSDADTKGVAETPEGGEGDQDQESGNRIDSNLFTQKRTESGRLSVTALSQSFLERSLGPWLAGQGKSNPERLAEGQRLGQRSL